MPRRRAARRSPRRHEVKAHLSNFQLAKALSALTLMIFSGGVKVGEVQLGRGSLYWRGRKRHKVRRIDWERFTEMMDQLAYPR